MSLFTSPSIRKCLSESLGTYILVFFGTGAIIINEQFGGVITHLGIALAFGAVVTTVIYGLGDISGAHINPAVTIAFWAAGKMKGKEVPLYIASQLIGALIASWSLHLLFPENLRLGLTEPAGSVLQTFVLEVILTFFLMLVIIHVATGSKEKGVMAGLAIGIVVMLEALVAGPVTGASMNPARSFSPALVSGFTEHLWIYIIAPILGALISIVAWKLLQKK